ncbi:Teichuronic acid biosynthesis protein TuaB [Thalassovita gelatinovora]|uniref:Teichuronic acid biosynthesis protein TuaB n=1 Tax=Thalassovita gelatinovora TaxID=53501 RepID=A0A0P1FW22_THAGE|nr:oligosaccharide flippase family protein [Thalassovita gelatinovora]QIZ81264.1 oligosaccharide flippase family protein [Thalassovita gelatinovora]CUH64608.1 Teichuronic acid biosynthesis protein TuaB [Thalassovita gelatinovora]SEP95061.1 Membrane protein involved in the export of O-antigen and teichoic acid [Thalassovita gelatinovora]
MINTFRRFSLGSSLTERALRSSAITSLGFVVYQGLRLISNLVLTRILFPEAFGLMALVSVVMMGLAMFSDVGVSPSIMQSARGDEEDFLNTAWTIQIIRGVNLWIVTCLLAYPVSVFYQESQLLYLLPVAGLTLLINGFNPTKLETANRHMRAGRVTLIDIGVQVVGLVVAVIAAWITGSVWALVLSGLVSAIAQVVFLAYFLPGVPNRLRWEKSAANELIHFGKWIFLSTICGFFIGQSDKLVIGKYLSLDEFGVYNIGFFLASFPLLLGGMVTRKVLIPIYRENPPKESVENFLRLRKMRFYATGFLMVMVTTVALLGVWLVDLLYDARYLRAGAVVVVLACVQLPQIIVLTYDQAALAAGDSKRFFVLAAARGVLIFAGLLIGLELAGLLGALLGLGLAYISAYPVVVWLSRHQGAWDPLHDAIFALISALVISLILWLHWDDILKLAQ